MRFSENLSSHMEDYLEVIGLLVQKNKVVRVKDISRTMKVKTPSVTAALGVLSEKGFVVHERYGYVELTPEGIKVAECVQKRHNTLVKFLTEILDIDPGIAAEDACKMEHSVSQETAEKLTKFVEFVSARPFSEKPEWLCGFEHYTKTGKRIQCKVREKTDNQRKKQS